jgi:hypothetical protein
VSGSVDVAASIGFLNGDENMSGTLTSSDLLRMKGRTGQALGGTTYLYDVTLDGSITADDQAAAKAKAGSALR